MTSGPATATPPSTPPGTGARWLDRIERLGNRLPDPAVLFLLLLGVVWVISAVMAPMTWTDIDPRTRQPIQVQNQLTGTALATFLARMVTTFTSFHPLGVVLVALLGVGVAEHTGFINAGLKALLRVTSVRLLTPVLIAVGILSHTAADAGYVLVIPLGGVIFKAAGRHPLAGIAAAFAGVSGGFSATFVPSSLDPLLAGLTQEASRLLDPSHTVNPLSNYYFTTGSSLLIILIGWFITDRIIEPRVSRLAIDGDATDVAHMGDLDASERRGLRLALFALVVGLALLVAASWSETSPLRAPDGQLTAATAPLMQAIVPFIFLFFIIPGVVYGYAAGTVKTHRDVIAGMSRAMGTMSYYIVLAFFVSLFIYAFGQSNLGALFALKGAAALKASGLPAEATIVGIIMLSAVADIFIGSASAKWAVLAPIFVPMLMQIGISPELTQAAYRIGDSSTNIVTPLMPYFPLVVVFCQRYVRATGIGTLVSMMLPYSLAFLFGWTVFLLGYWALGIPLGIQGGYVHP